MSILIRYKIEYLSPYRRKRFCNYILSCNEGLSLVARIMFIYDIAFEKLHRRVVNKMNSSVILDSYYLYKRMQMYLFCSIHCVIKYSRKIKFVEAHNLIASAKFLCPRHKHLFVKTAPTTEFDMNIFISLFIFYVL